MSLEPGVAERLEAKHKGGVYLAARKVEYSADADEVELCYEHGWSDGLPVTPPTDARVLRMLKGTARKADEVIGHIPPYLAPCTIEKVAINAVMAGCKPEYIPVLLAALEAALEPVFTLHGVLATTTVSYTHLRGLGDVYKRQFLRSPCFRGTARRPLSIKNRAPLRG